MSNLEKLQHLRRLSGLNGHEKMLVVRLLATGVCGPQDERTLSAIWGKHVGDRASPHRPAKKRRIAAI
jgi:hypothetical protein